MKEKKLTNAGKKVLQDQVITADTPGTVLRDFVMLLDFLGPRGVEAGGKSNLLHLKHIGELDEHLCHPLRLKLTRPLLKSHPYLQGLHLLLRATGLSRVEGVGAKARLVLDPAMLAQWVQLNPTEQFFSLLEAWLRFGRSEMVGESGGMMWGGMLLPTLQVWQRVPEEGRRYDTEKARGGYYLPGIGGDLYLLALLDLFGLMKIEQAPRQLTTWTPASVKHAPFGDACLTLLLSQVPLFLGKMTSEEEDDGDPEEGLPEALRFGAWQPLFQPYFPEWRENLKFPAWEPREGTFVFRVSLGKAWRLIAMPADATLDDLVDSILHSVKFDHDHLYQFTYRDRLGSTVSAHHSAMDEGPWADEILIGTLPLEPGQTMQLEYDFGDNWEFTVKLERIEPPGPKKLKAPRILESHGKAPKQYPNWD